jgi:WhiB family redox-sensing transcriptional regulator
VIDDYSGNDRWQLRAACRGSDTDLFFPERGESSKEAKAVCAICPVRQQCLDFAISEVEHYGIWGGLSERERRELRRQLPRRAPKPPPLPVSAFRATKDPTAAERGRRYRAKLKMGDGLSA